MQHLGLSRIAFKHVSAYVPWENSGLRTCCVAFNDNDDDDDDLYIIIFQLNGFFNWMVTRKRLQHQSNFY